MALAPPWPAPDAKLHKMHYLGLCCIVKDETPFLEEWIAFHTLMGVESFVIYDNGSAQPVKETLRHMLSPGYIRVLAADGKALQMPCYNHCLETFGHEFFWLGFIDMDEFALPVAESDLRLLLKSYERHAGLGGNWLIFGSSGHKTRPQGLQIENYTMAMPELKDRSRHVKLFAQPGRIRNMYNPHLGVFKPGEHAVDTAERPLVGPFSLTPDWSRLQINHYYYRSTQDYYAKLNRGMADSTRKHHIPEKLNPPHGTVQDLKAALYAPIVRDLIAGAPQGMCAALARSKHGGK